ncbi:MAG TPA: hypothetical protein VKG45_14850 [Actinomycetes bacterium]|nr:hypothetical protein [Actinomycetes bacterium]
MESGEQSTRMEGPMRQRRATQDDWSPGDYDRAAAAARRRELVARLAELPGPTIGELLAAQPEGTPPTAQDIDVMLQAIYDARDEDLAGVCMTDPVAVVDTDVASALFGHHYLGHPLRRHCRPWSSGTGR